MIENLKPYPEYKDSGLPWLGQVPAHWEIRRGKSLFSESNLPVRDGDEIVTSFRDGQVTLRKNRRTSGFMTALYEAGYQGVRTGQLVIHAMDAFAGAIGISDSDGKCTPEYIVLDPLSNSAHPSYFSQLLRHAARQQFILVQCPAVRERAPRFRYPDFGCMWMPLPPANEQAAIARLLTWATNRLDRAIGAKRHIITLLQEQKQAIIHRAVTRGLDPSVPLKDSGIPWLGEIPEHWEVITVGAISELLQTGPFGSQLHQSDYVKSGTPVINPSHLSGGRIRHDSGVTITSAKAEALSRHRLKANDILIARRGDLGRCAKATALEDGWICGTGSLLLRCKSNLIKSDFLQIAFSSRGMRQMLELSSIGATMANLNEGSVARQRIPLPPIAEQEGIVDSIRTSSETENAAFSRLEGEIILLREYRTRLIADVVTGKLDVRELAAGLPEEVASDDAQDATEDDLDLEDEVPENLA